MLVHIKLHENTIYCDAAVWGIHVALQEAEQNKEKEKRKKKKRKSQQEPAGSLQMKGERKGVCGRNSHCGDDPVWGEEHNGMPSGAHTHTHS